MKNKTLATWLSLTLGCLGLHRFYVYGPRDYLAWCWSLPTLAGAYGLYRIQTFGVDDISGNWLVLVLGLQITSACLNAIWWGLQHPTQWNQQFNPTAQADDHNGNSNWLTVIAIVASLMIGATALMSVLSLGFQRLFEQNLL